MKISAHEVAWLAIKRGFNPVPPLTSVSLVDSEVVLFVATCQAESGFETDIMGAPSSMTKPDGSPNPAGGQVDHGLAQISGYWHWDKIAAYGGAWRDPEVNVAIAYQIFTDAGRSLNPWNAYKSGAHLKYLPLARIAAARPFPFYRPTFTLRAKA